MRLETWYDYITVWLAACFFIGLVLARVIAGPEKPDRRKKGDRRAANRATSSVRWNMVDGQPLAAENGSWVLYTDVLWMQQRLRVLEDEKARLEFNLALETQ